MPTCPHCGHEADARARECPLCGTPLSADADGGAGRPGGERAEARPGEAVGPGGPVPWEDPELGFLEGAGRTWRESLFEPDRFFRRIRGGGTVARPLLYFLLVTVVAAFFGLVWQAAGVAFMDVASYAGAGDAMALGPVVSFLVSPFAALAGLLVATLVYHLGALMVAPDRRGMAATARVVCYAAGPSLLAVVPVVGSLAGAIWTVVLQVVGLREVHRTTTLRALFMVFWVAVGFFLLGIAVALVVGLVGGDVGGGALARAAAG